MKPEPKTAVKTLRTLSRHYSYLASSSRGPSSKKAKSGGVTADEVGGEWQTVMEAEYYDFVLFEIPKVLT